MPFPLPFFPPTATTDHITDHSSIDASIGFSGYTDPGPDYGGRLELGGQYVSARGAGVYGRIPVSHIHFDGESYDGVGNLELGGLWVLPRGAHTELILRGGVVLPTSREDNYAIYSNEVTSLARTTDLALIYPSTTFVRASVSPLYQNGAFFLRADLGLDVAVDAPDGQEIDPLARVNLAIGYRSGKTTVAGEVATIATTGDADLKERILSTLGISVAYDAGSVRPYAAVVVPVVHELARDARIEFAVMFGIEVPF